MKIKFLSFLISLLIFISCDSSKGVTVVKLGHGLDTSHSVHKAMVYMNERLNEMSDGKMRIDIYPSQQLGSERECIELLQVGSLGMTKVSSGVLENFSPDFKIFGLPFLFNDSEHLFRVLEGEVGKEILNSTISQRVKGLTFYDAGSRSFYTKTPVETPQDLSGLKIRVMESQTAMNMVRQLGGSPTPIAWGELYTALQQGIVDGAENNLPSFHLSRHYEVCKHYIMDQHTALPDVLLVGTPVWESLTAQEQEWLQTAAEESLIYQKKIWKESEETALDEIQKAGVTVTEVNKEDFRELVEPMYNQFEQDPEIKEIIQKIESAK